ncbi:MAG: serine/threonine-protein phosphatase [Chloroflexi bacterium]|nr:MAG: serine/threonine-protein phosphatase [Chloroflexota bacterium]
MDLFRRWLGQPSTKDSPEDNLADADANVDTKPAIGQQIQDTEQEHHAAARENPNDTEVSTANLTPQETSDYAIEGATRPLPMEAIVSSTNVHLRFGQSTDTGMVRNNNQDSAYSFFVTSRTVENHPDFGLFIVADGMGGHHDGEKASAITSRIFASNVIKNIYLPLITGQNNADQPPITEALIDAVHMANNEVIAHIPEGGTTLTAVVVIGNLAYIAHVGDSRVYLITQNDLEQITRDHSWVQRMIELDQITPEEALHHPQKNVLYRALGQSEALEVDAVTRRMPANSKMLLCSDGLWNLVEDDEIYETIMNHSSHPQEACDKLVALANTRGGTDNITAILLEIPGS